MRKRVTFQGVRFSIPTIRAAFAVFEEVGSELPAAAPPVSLVARYSALTITTDRGEEWAHDNVDEFFADYARPFTTANVDFRMVYEGPTSSASAAHAPTVDVYLYPNYASVSVVAEQRGTIERIMRVFEDAAPSSLLPIPETPIERISPRVFIGHGGSQTWRLLKDHLADQHHYDVVAYETGARAGHTIRDVLEEMLGASNFALLVMTAEDEQGDGSMRARQNVVHEAGLFQGKLGFPRAIILLEEGVENFSNLAGVQYIPFSRGNIRETFGDVLATLRREFGAQ